MTKKLLLVTVSKKGEVMLAAYEGSVIELKVMLSTVGLFQAMLVNWKAVLLRMDKPEFCVPAIETDVTLAQLICDGTET